MEKLDTLGTKTSMALKLKREIYSPFFFIANL